MVFNLINLDMKDGYPTKLELTQIKNFNPNKANVFEFLEWLKDIWTYDSFNTKWVNNKAFGLCFRVELATCGWSGNESIIEALLNNVYFKHMWYAEWQRGGLHIFEINTASMGFMLVADYCKENKISRQAIYKHQLY